MGYDNKSPQNETLKAFLNSKINSEGTSYQEMVETWLLCKEYQNYINDESMK